MRKRVLIFFLALTIQNVFCQEFELVKHQVEMGETVRMLSKKYRVRPSEIYDLNKFAVDGISEGMVLQILVPKKEIQEIENKEPGISQESNTNPMQENAIAEPIGTSEEITHTVAPKETLYSLSKKYNVSVEDLKNQNAALQKNGLQAGQVLTIRVQK